jgi:hypothetical protein
MNCICINIGVVTNLSILLTIFVSRTQGLQNSEVKRVTSECSSDCWSTANLTHIKAIILDSFKDIWKKEEIRLTNSVVIEKTANVSTEDNGSLQVKSAEEGRGYDDADKMVESIGKFLSTHALRVNLWNFGTLRIERSQENSQNFEVIFYMNRGTTNNDGRGKCKTKLFLKLTLTIKTEIRFTEIFLLPVICNHAVVSTVKYVVRTRKLLR